MKKRLLVVVVALAGTLVCGSAFGGEVASRFLGYEAINRVVQERLLKPVPKVDMTPGQYVYYSTYNLGHYLDVSSSGTSIYGKELLYLMGAVQSQTLDGSFQNGAPNVINTTLWHVALSGLAKDVGNLCETNPVPGAPSNRVWPRDSYNERFLAVVKTMCVWPSPEAKTDEGMQKFWTALVGYDAPESEFVAWKEFFRGPAYKRASAVDAVTAMTLAALNNPYFLLKK